MNDTTIIPAQLGFFVLEPFTNDKNQYSGFHKYPVLAWKVIECATNHTAFSLATPVILCLELFDSDIGRLAIEMPNGQVQQIVNSHEQWFASAQAWFDTLREVF